MVSQIHKQWLMWRQKIHTVTYDNMLAKYESHSVRIGGFRHVFGKCPTISEDSHQTPLELTI
jgi:hypothetical protein